LRRSSPKGDRISDHHLSLPEEAELVRQLLSHDEHAFTLAVRAYQGKMLRLARALVGEAMAEEVVQETWLAVLKALPDFEGRARLKTWILRILCNIAKSQLRREARSARTTQWWDDDPPGEARFDANGQWQSPPCPWQEETPEALLKAEELRQCIESAIAALPPAQQAVLTLHDIEGLAMDEICNILAISPTNGRVLLHRARARLWAAVENYEKERGC
jgi:RNA polymerase sigma-70 factor, ECF subfamily